MKNSLISLLMVLCCAIFMGGCTSERMNTTSCETLKLSSFKGVLHDSLIFKDRFVIALETNDASLIRKIDRLCLDGDTLAVFDRSLNKIVLFKNDGQHICTIHDVGSGPAEYVYSITEVAENDERLVFTTNLGFFLYDKESKELNGYRFIRNSNLNGGVSTIMTMNDGKHIAVNYKSSTFRRLIDSKMARGEKAKDDFLRVYNFIDDESNPILLVYPF